MNEHTVGTFEDASAEIGSLWLNQNTLAARVRLLEKALETRATPCWKRLLFRLDGWPSWPQVAEAPAPRFWHRWWVS